MEDNYTRSRRAAESGMYNAAIAFALLALVEIFDDEEGGQP